MIIMMMIVIVIVIIIPISVKALISCNILGFLDVAVGEFGAFSLLIDVLQSALGGVTTGLGGDDICFLDNLDN